MRLDKIKFAELVKYITGLRPEVHFEVSELDDLIDINVEPVTIPTEHVEAARVDELLQAMAADEKIKAIRAYRSFTGLGLKESKDAIENNWPNKKSKTYIIDVISNYFMINNIHTDPKRSEEADKLAALISK